MLTDPALDHVLDTLQSLIKGVDLLLQNQAETLHRIELLESCDNPLPYTSEDHRGL